MNQPISSDMTAKAQEIRAIDPFHFKILINILYRTYLRRVTKKKNLFHKNYKPQMKANYGTTQVV